MARPSTIKSPARLVLKNPNPLKDDEASALLDAAVLVLALFWGSSMW